MAIITLSSLGHSPGTTTTAVAMTLHWSRPALLVEADGTSTSTVLAGRLRGQVAHRLGLTSLASAATHNELDVPLLWANSIELSPDRRLVPGFSTLGAARGAASFWTDLVPLLTSLEGAGTDVIIDLGRCEADDPRAALVTSAQLVLVATGTTLPDIAATTAPVDGGLTRISEMSDLLDAVGRADGLRLVAIEGATENYSANEIRRVTGIPVAGALPNAPAAAAVYSLGTEVRGSRHRGQRQAFEHAVDALVTTASRVLADDRSRIGAPATETRFGDASEGQA